MNEKLVEFFEVLFKAIEREAKDQEFVVMVHPPTGEGCPHCERVTRLSADATPTASSDGVQGED